MTIKWTFLLMVFALSGCASRSVERNADFQSQTVQYCIEQKWLGSHVKQKRCRTAREIEQEHRRVQEVMRIPTVNQEMSGKI